MGPRVLGGLHHACPPPLSSSQFAVTRLLVGRHVPFQVRRLHVCYLSSFSMQYQASNTIQAHDKADCKQSVLQAILNLVCMLFEPKVSVRTACHMQAYTQVLKRQVMVLADSRFQLPSCQFE